MYLLCKVDFSTKNLKILYDLEWYWDDEDYQCWHSTRNFVYLYYEDLTGYENLNQTAMLRFEGDDLFDYFQD